MAGRGRGGGSRGGKGAGGIDFPWNHDPDIDQYLNWQPIKLFPDVEATIAAPPTADELRTVYHSRRIREMRRAGPFWATGDLNKRAGRGAGGRDEKGNDTFNAFTGMDTYSKKYVPKKRVLPDMKSYPFVKEFFPKELWDVMGISDDEDDTKKAADGTQPPPKKRKMLQIAKANDMSRLEALEAEAKRKADAGEDDDDEEKEEEDGEGGDEVQDDDFEADESDGDDYNAEAYFDNGEDDFGEEDAGGDDGGYYE
ncbi:uncharacterized protein BDZ99DRAFT_219249 [Mytilinidion resinicola]|uniref:DNA-directed RNA polymerase III subunit n=1 Tax=Mytilinidion resinicola TaxID=574789 RepID=A0A6A6XZ68_9PEZI|nr:uncharacterized protein BDZ99DRAFT_219249 [Mytilinidion resinicola]KAF2801553.1 hypothetical protein BDZ99DRAFT_219249 [Mytilinidion resinicola]